jgi:hypothetical protein
MICINIKESEMQLTIDVKDSAIDKILYFLENLKSDVKILDKKESSLLDIQSISKDDKDFKFISEGRQERKTHPQNYGSLNDVNWD